MACIIVNGVEFLVPDSQKVSREDILAFANAGDCEVLYSRPDDQAGGLIKNCKMFPAQPIVVTGGESFVCG